MKAAPKAAARLPLCLAASAAFGRSLRRNRRRSRSEQEPSEACLRPVSCFRAAPQDARRSARSPVCRRVTRILRRGEGVSHDCTAIGTEGRGLPWVLCTYAALLGLAPVYDPHRRSASSRACGAGGGRRGQGRSLPASDGVEQPLLNISVRRRSMTACARGAYCTRGAQICGTRSSRLGILELPSASQRT